MKIKRPESWQRYVHLLSIIGQGVALYIAFDYLPPWLAKNPGVILFACVIMAQDIAHFCLHNK